MSVMLSKTYTALKQAGVSESAAIEAAEEIASYEKDISEMKSDLKVIKWGTALIIAVVVLPYFKALFIQ